LTRGLVPKAVRTPSGEIRRMRSPTVTPKFARDTRSDGDALVKAGDVADGRSGWARGGSSQVFGADAEDLDPGIAALAVAMTCPLISGAARVTPGTARSRSASAS
jgi:hypothetical protein